MSMDPKNVMALPEGPLAPEERKLAAEYERPHVKFSRDPSPEDYERLHVKFSKDPSPEDCNYPIATPRVWILASDTLASLMETQTVKRYFVHWGYMHRNVEEFTDFQRALDYYVDHKGGPSGARLVGDGYDADCGEDGFHEVSDGLSERERERVEAVS